MELFIAAFKSVAVLMGIGVIGFTILARKTLPIDALRVITPLVIDVSLPCMIFYNIITRFDPREMPGWWQLPLWWLGMVAFFLVLSLVSRRFVNREFRGETGMALFYPNATFFPIGIIPIIYGPDTTLLVELFIFTLFMPVIVFNGYSFFFRSKIADRKFNLKDSKILNPILVATVLAVVFKWTRFDAAIPDFVISITEIVGATALPLLMLNIGGNVYVDFIRRGKFDIRSSAKVHHCKKRPVSCRDSGHAAPGQASVVSRNSDHNSGGCPSAERRPRSDRKSQRKCGACQSIPYFQLYVLHHHNSSGYVVFQPLL